jgi:hypothetical protein
MISSQLEGRGDWEKRRQGDREKRRQGDREKRRLGDWEKRRNAMILIFIVVFALIF